MGFEQDVKDALQAAVKEAGSNKALADCAGINPATLYRWMNGERDPNLSGLAKVMDYLGMTVAKRGFEPTPLPPGSPKGVAASILEHRRQAELERENAYLEGQIKILREAAGLTPNASKNNEKNAG